MKVYRVKKEDVESLRALVGSQGSVIIPVEDANGNLIIGLEDLECKEFDLSMYEFEEIEFELAPVTNFRNKK